MKSNKPLLCEGYRRYGGAFTFGPMKWEQCKEKAEFQITVKQEEEGTQTFPMCKTCWKEAVKNKMDIKEVKLL